MATYTNFDDEIFSQAALEGYTATLLPLSRFSINYMPEPAPKGNTVLVPLIGALTATTFSTYATTNGSLSAVTVTINRHKIVGVGQSDLDAANSSIAQLERFGFQQGAALALAVLQDIASLWTTAAANFALATAVSIVDFGIAQIRAGRKLLSNSKAPANNRVMILDVDPFDNLLGISNFIQVNLSGSNETLRDGRIGRALGFDIFESNGLPGTNSVMGFMGHPSAIAIAMRYLMPQAGHKYDIARPVADNETGAVFGIRAHYDENSGNRYVNLEANYGYSVGITHGGRVLKRLD
jgi:hypothetical protein